MGGDALYGRSGKDYTQALAAEEGERLTMESKCPSPACTAGSKTDQPAVQRLTLRIHVRSVAEAM